ncbi:MULTISPECIES: SusD/RagB family nutrient-binding outer membrane lipoprotein [Cellulophaga]|uniref:SusD/RagB family nutrient-binding outer membrane lipoprotein n=1 Tax=Cellulophaga geojensis KL-A TaxID=1328323 RepID=A0ABN0RKM2_9FLAO|nr:MULTISPECIES: SusD/RagB family nutrient-binding outer membrane lipoprotein [Cellulophaga]EWH12419.1 hypothetical protein KLA_14860 [Cellulophaga geojensis KL-A]SNQ42781.1 conserved exported hypothetical protein [Cellulophaga lytica]
MKTIKFLLFSSLILVQLISCTSDFEETNTDPNKLENITAGSAINPIIYSLAVRNANEARNNNFGLMQVFYRIDDLSGQPFLYDLRTDIGASLWRDYYKALTNIVEMEKAAVLEEKVNYQAVALTLKTYAFSILTDTFGDIPMTEALQAETGILFPKFSTQEEIYTQLLANLEQANNLYDTSVGMVYENDILFDNDVTKWQKFTNSLRLRLLLRISGKKDTYQEMVSILNNPSKYPVFTSNEDAAVLNVTGEAPNLSPWDRASDFGLFRYYGDFFIDNLNKFNDPRRSIYATPARGINDEDLGYIGQPIDFSNNPLPDNIASASGINQEQIIAPMIIPLMTYSEVEFIKAELAQKGYLTNAEIAYNNGVTAAIELWGAEVPNDYFNNSNAAYNNTLERIMLQKYYALYLTDYQSWFEHRRTGFPVLPTTDAMFNDKKMPSRFFYPIAASTLNSDNYQEAVNRIGGNEINVKVWWDNN